MVSSLQYGPFWGARNKRGRLKTANRDHNLEKSPYSKAPSLYNQHPQPRLQSLFLRVLKGLGFWVLGLGFGSITYKTLGKLRGPEGVEGSIREPWATYPP